MTNPKLVIPIFWGSLMMILCYKALCFVANFSAPSLLKSELVPCVLNLVGHCVSSQPETSCCCFLSPCFSYKGNLFTEEYGLLRTLSGSGCCVDASFQLLFDIKSKTESWQTSSNIKKHMMISFNKVEIWGVLGSKSKNLLFILQWPLGPLTYPCPIVHSS